VFVDANVMVYFFLQVEPFAETCRDFFQRVGHLEIEAFTGADVAGTVIHRVMVAEAITKLGLQPTRLFQPTSHPTWFDPARFAGTLQGRGQPCRKGTYRRPALLSAKPEEPPAFVVPGPSAISVGASHVTSLLTADC
jgi:hypothetical protein